jgi:hypothetical protein
MVWKDGHMNRAYLRFLVSALCLTTCLALHAVSIVEIDANGASIFTFNINAGSVSPSDTASSPFNITYTEDITSFSFVAQTNGNWTKLYSDTTGTYDIKIDSLWLVDFTMTFTDTGDIFGNNDIGDLLGGNATAQHRVNPKDPFDNPTGDPWTATIPVQSASAHLPATTVTIPLHDTVGDLGDTRYHQPIPHYDIYSNAFLTYQTAPGDTALEGNISNFKVTIDGQHSPTLTPEPPSYVLALIGMGAMLLGRLYGGWPTHAFRQGR